MTDQNLAVVTNSYLDLAIQGAMGDAPSIPESKTLSIPKLALVQSTSEKYVELGGLGKWALDYNDGITPPKFFDKINVWLFGIYPSRIFFAREKDGARTSLDTPPACGSPDGKAPYDTHIGKQIFDFRNGKTVTIGDSCDSCPFQEWHNRRNSDGEYMLDNDGNKQGERPCMYAPRYALWVAEIGFVALFKPTSANVRRFMEGRKKPVIAGIDKYFLPNGTVVLQNGVALDTWPTKPDGFTPHFVTLGVQKIKDKARDKTVYVPDLSVNPSPIPMDLFIQQKEHRESWEKYRQAALERADQFADDEEETMIDPATSPLTAEEIQKAAETYGSGPKGKRRTMAAKEEDVVVFEDET